ncbi:hypothetical protein HPB52_016799 [Rhipicephalus sanguineus]|uniref:Uncharacterized protein n=1 Tax=Rhipicephalus sanguineus TaxID=34632 RepID=A0A9D4SUR3_RHISA|nr:hypothetical protein HPB52_016799 [Rhipicephalus sanguineus]
MCRETRFNGCSPISVDINASVTNRSNWSNQIKQLPAKLRSCCAVAFLAMSSPGPSVKKKRRQFSLKEKVDILTELNAGKKQRLVINIRLRLPRVVNIRQAAEMLTGSWWNVKASTIRDCWRKACLLKTSLTPQDCEPTPRDCDDEAELDPELWNELTEKLLRDCAAATSVKLTCEEIVSQVREQDCCSSDEDDAGGAEGGTTEETISISDVVVFLEKT